MAITELNDFKKINTLVGNDYSASAFKKSLTTDDVYTVNMYYRWMTMNVSKRDGIDKLVAKTKYVKGCKNWEFTGIIDYGRKAVKCEADGCGAIIRYAFSAHATNNHGEGVDIVLGRDCMCNLFGVNAATLKNLNETIAGINIEVSKALAYGRYHDAWKSSIAFKILKVVKNNKIINQMFVDELGKTAVELYLNFMKCGFMLPKTLNDLVELAYKTVIEKQVWGTNSHKLFDGDKYNQVFDILSAECHSFNAHNYDKSKYFNSIDITTDSDISYLINQEARNVIASVLINGYVYAENYELDFIVNMAELFRSIEKVSIDDEHTTPSIVLKHISADKDYEEHPVSILRKALKYNDLNLVVVFFDVTDMKSIINLYQVYMSDLLKGTDDTEDFDMYEEDSMFSDDEDYENEDYEEDYEEDYDEDFDEEEESMFSDEDYE